MRSFTLVSVVLALASSTSSQLIRPDSVPIGTRQTWCTNQRTQCPLLCTQQDENQSTTTRQNFCEPETLSYACVCGNGKTISSTQYSQTIPYFECTEANNACERNCGISNPACAASCRQDVSRQCGASDPERASSSSLAASATASGTRSANTADSSADPTANFDTFGSQPTGRSQQQGGNSGAAGLPVGQSFGVAIAVTGLLAGFSVML